MVLIKNTAFFVLVFLCAALSTARLNPTGAAVNEIPDIEANIATSITKRYSVKSLAAIDEGNLNKPSATLGKVMSSSNVEGRRNVRSLSPDEVAFTADYHRPVHHPPKNNK
ncbi:hypothetical protein CR513_59016, partial [Mucuna pruriens]